MSNYHTLSSLMKSKSGQDVWPTSIYIQITGDHLFGLLLDRVVWWSDKGKRDDGYFYKTAEDWSQELSISYAQLTRARKALEAMNFIKTKRKKANGYPTIHYWVNIEIIEQQIEQLFGETAQVYSDDYAKLEKVEIEESLKRKKSKSEIEESLKTKEIEESRKTITELTIPNNKTNDSREMFSAFVELCQIDLETITKDKRGEINQAEKRMRQKYKPADLEAFGVWWYQHDWRGQKGQPPEVHQIRDCWGKFLAYRRNGARPPDSSPAPKIDPAHARRLKELAAQEVINAQ